MVRGRSGSNFREIPNRKWVVCPLPISRTILALLGLLFYSLLWIGFSQIDILSLHNFFPFPRALDIFPFYYVLQWENKMTSCQRLEKGIVTGCTISVVLFVMGINLIINAAKRETRRPDSIRGILTLKQRLHGQLDSTNQDTCTSKMGTNSTGGDRHLG